MNKREEWQKIMLDARAIADRAEKEGRDFTAEERQQIENLFKAAKDLKAQIQKAQEDAEMVKQLLALDAEFQAPERRGQVPVPAGKGVSLGERFVNSAEFSGWMKAFGGRIPDGARGIQSPPVQFKGLKELITGSDDNSAGAFVETDYTRIYEPLGRYPLNVLGLVNRRTTTSDLVHFVRQTVKVQEAAVVAEANITTPSGATGEVSGEKPEAQSTWEPVTEPVKTIAAWIPATKRALSDASQIRGIIDQELRDDVNEELEDQVLNGDGVGENFTGIMQTAGILIQAWDTDALVTARRAIATLEVTGLSKPTAFVLNPEDWASVELMRDGDNRFYYSGPQAQGPRTLWGVPVVTSQSMAQGTGLLGDFRKAIIWDREAATITVSDSHEDFFIRNMVAILCELRAAFGVIRPSAFITVAQESGS